MKTKSMGFMLTVVFCIEVSGAVIQWTGADAANDPSWSNGLNWQGGVAPVAGDTAEFPDDAGEITVDADDLGLFRSLPVITGVDRKSTVKIVLTASGEITITNKMAYLTFVNRGGADVSLTRGTANMYEDCGFTVENGSLKLAVDPADNATYYNYSSVAVSNDATLYLPYTGKKILTAAIDVLVNEGTVATCGNNRSSGLRITGIGGAPSVLAGTIEGYIDFQPHGTDVHLRGSDHSFTGYTRIWSLNLQYDKGTLFIDSIGTSGEPSSCGSLDKLEFLYNGGRYVYLGDGETTDRGIAWPLSWHDYTPYHEPEFDAGAKGGVTFTGPWTLHSSVATYTTQHNTIVLSGSNTVPCVVDCAFETLPDDDSVNYTTYITKRGTGTWRFNDNPGRENKGVIAVEEGTLQFETIAEQGAMCSLGLATRLYGKHFGDSADGVPADYAYLLGTADQSGAATTEGVMQHLGSGNASCATRPIALSGDGRLDACGGMMHFSGVSAAAAGEKTFTLGGTNSFANMLSGVTDGSGKVSLSKEGTNTWLISGALDFSGDLSVKEGVLEVVGAGLQYTWFRFNSYEVHSTKLNGKADSYRYQHKFDEFALFDAAGNRQNIGFTYPADDKTAAGYNEVDGDASGLEPGTMCPGRAGGWFFYAKGAFGLAKLTDEKTGMNDNFVGSYSDATGKAASTADRPDRRLSIAMRLTNGTPEIVRYDFCSSAMNASSVSNCPSVFSLEGSWDGKTWVPLHSFTSTAVNSGGARWSSDDTPFDTAYSNAGYAIAGSTAGSVPLTNLRSVSVAAGATLRAHGTVSPVKGLVVDAEGAGTIEGFAFSDAEGCTLDVRNAGDSFSFELPGTYENVTGLDNVKNWTLRVNGNVTTRYSVFVRNGRISLAKKGLILSIR